MFGAATAACQIEGSNFGGCGPNHWDSFDATPFNVVRAPGHRDIRATARAMYHVLLAHGAAVQRLRDMGQTNIGIVLNFDVANLATDAPVDRAAATLWDAIFNRWFIEGITRKTYPEQALAGLSSHMPDKWQDDMDLIGQPLDWLGVNYYTRHIMAAAPGMPWPALRDVPGPLPKTQMGWEIYPQGLENFLTRMARDYVGNLPLYVTESGMASADVLEDGSVSDGTREDYLFSHLAATRRAIYQGANVKGFFYWSLLDNYEWAGGYEKRFGLVHVDFISLERTPKSSYHAFAHALARNT